MKRRLVIFLVLLWLPSDVLAGAWVREPGSVYLRLANKAYFADSIFSNTGSRVGGDWWDSQARFREFSFNLIAEVGVADKLTLTFENTAKLMNSDYSDGIGGMVSVNGLSDILLGARYGFYQKNLVAAVEAKLEVPTGYPDERDRVRLGPGEVNGQLKLLFGGGLPLGIRNYFDSAIGYRVRGGAFSDDLLASAAVGVETLESLWARVGFSGVFNLGDASDVDSLGNQEASYMSAGGALTYLFESGLGLELAASVDVWGRNTFSGWGLEVVVQYER